MELKLRISEADGIKSKKDIQNIDQKINDYFFRQKRSIEEILVWASENNCSDVWVKVMEQPYISIYGMVKQLPCKIIDKNDWSIWYGRYVLNEYNAQYVRKKTLDLSVEVRMREDGPDFGKYNSNYYRYRCALSYSQEYNTATFRMIKPYTVTFDKLNYPKETIRALEDAMSQKSKITILTGVTGSGKALHKNTPIPTPFGFTTMGKLNTGDLVFGAKGEVVKVIGKYQSVENKFYQVRFSNNESVNTCGSHLWQLHHNEDKLILSTKSILENGMVNNNEYRLGRNACVDYSTKTLGIAPYYYGKLIGLENGINKISDIYKQSDKLQRLELLSGLVDTKGSTDSFGGISIPFIKKTILEDVRELCLSLGYYCEIKKDNVLYFMPNDILPLRVSDNLKNLKNNLRVENNGIYIIDIIEVKGNPKDYYCIEVESDDHLYLCTKSFIPTHNSSTIAATLNTYSKSILNHQTLITLEDPIENTIEPSETFNVIQQELHLDFLDFESGVNTALRSHPNIVLIGEARSREVISAVVNAAQTGHSTISTYHAGSVSGCVSRILQQLDGDVNLSYDLISNLGLIVAQRMLKSDKGYVVDTQFMLFNEEITSRLLDVIFSDKKTNVALEVEKLMKDEYFLEKGYVKGWDFYD